jgi:hypothetical protein
MKYLQTPLPQMNLPTTLIRITSLNNNTRFSNFIQNHKNNEFKQHSKPTRRMSV